MFNIYKKEWNHNPTLCTILRKKLFLFKLVFSRKKAWKEAENWMLNKSLVFLFFFSACFLCLYREREAKKLGSAVAEKDEKDKETS